MRGASGSCGAVVVVIPGAGVLDCAWPAEGAVALVARGTDVFFPLPVSSAGVGSGEEASDTK